MYLQGPGVNVVIYRKRTQGLWAPASLWVSGWGLLFILPSSRQVVHLEASPVLVVDTGMW